MTPPTSVERLTAAFEGGLQPQEVAVLPPSVRRLGVCDPLVQLDHPLVVEVAASGGVPVFVAGGDARGDFELAWAELERGVPVRWESVGAFGVDSGTGCFVDMDAPPAAIEAVDVEGELCGSHGSHLAWFKSGAGDGVYGVHRGLDAEGKTVVVAIDFGLSGLARLALDGPDIDGAEQVIAALAECESTPGPRWFDRFAPDGLSPLWATCADGWSMTGLLQRVGADPDGVALGILYSARARMWATLGEVELAAQMTALLPDLSTSSGPFNELSRRAARQARSRYPRPSTMEQMRACVRGEPLDPRSPLRRAEVWVLAETAVALRAAGFEAPDLHQLP